ncbi:GntR family transcriptional regulator [Leeia sp. TBRC 13508]|uniref:GntR family transcriptional regulator n=1 Tax=Leeia speluncae TaxID=2884804 RepID=A0ABS8D953_9NEIS|nr:GntR family transcriptional regulator [Leeia speluncae]MCB6184748.1 GntR family transcriptional regulator [Leeia speluncae]
MQHQIKDVQFLPLYQQVRFQLLQKISDSVWLAGEMIPSEFALADEFTVSQGTVRKALNVLVAEGLLVRRQGVGTFVSDWPEEWGDARLVFHGAEFSSLKDRIEPELLSCSKGIATDRVAEGLGIKRNTPVINIRRAWRLSGQLVAFDEVTLDASRFDRVDARLIKQHAGKLYKLYLAEFGVRVSAATEWFMAAGSIEADWVRFTDNVPVLKVERCTTEMNATIFEWRRIWVDSRRCMYRSA